MSTLIDLLQNKKLKDILTDNEYYNKKIIELLEKSINENEKINKNIERLLDTLQSLCLYIAENNNKK